MGLDFEKFTEKYIRTRTHFNDKMEGIVRPIVPK